MMPSACCLESIFHVSIGAGRQRDVVIVACLNESPFYNYSYRTVFPAVVSGTRCSTATCTTNGSIPTRRGIPAT